MKTVVIQIAVFACLLGLVMPSPDGEQFLDAECGIRAKHRSKRVINGTVANMTSSPWMVFLHTDLNVFVGGGTLISNRLVLTAASIARFNNLRARLGEYQRTRFSRCFGTYCTNREEHAVEKAIIPRNYNRNTFGNDIAILVLRRTVVYKPNIRPICIVRNTAEWRNTINDIQKLTGTGWGKTESEMDSDELRTLDIWRQPPAICAETVSNITSNQFCAGSPTGSLCYGDVGGPVGAMIQTTKGERFVQIGIASLTNIECKGDGVFTDVLSHMDFILRVWQKVQKMSA